MSVPKWMNLYEILQPLHPRNVVEMLPHGSGIDSDWYVDTCWDKRWIFCNSYHYMNCDGYYDGWVPFKVTLSVSKGRYMEHALVTQNKDGVLSREPGFNVLEIPGEVKLTVVLQTRRSLKQDLDDYLYDVISYTLDPVLKQEKQDWTGKWHAFGDLDRLRFIRDRALSGVSETLTPKDRCLFRTLWHWLTAKLPPATLHALELA